ncbi:MAG: M67 family metallopeptidase [Rhodospirillales bacterium]|nr:M67 family metallopeptidase [Rhodospirillales bacterium]
MNEITAFAEAAYPDECCGLLAGHGDGAGDLIVTRVVASANVNEVRSHDRFEVDPKVRFDLMRELDGGPDRIIGHYHSHPDHPAKPSGHDLDMAFEPDLVWLILSVMNGRAGEVTTHFLDREQRIVRTVGLEITSETNREKNE